MFSTIQPTQACVVSYNSRGFGYSKQKFCDNLTRNLCGDKLPVLCVQEHYVLKGNSYIVQKALPDSHIFFKSAIKEDQNFGRARNGMFIAVPANLKEKFSDVSPQSWRVQAVSFLSTLIVNVYFPTDPGTSDYDDNELNETLEVVQKVVDDNPAVQVVIAGDLNSDFSRNTGHVNDVKMFIQNLNLQMSWSKFPMDFTHTTVRNDVVYTHTLDHFLWGEGTDSDVVDAGVIHHVDNESDHSPIFCCINIPQVTISKSKFGHSKAKPSWKKSSLEDKNNFVDLLQTKLDNIVIPPSIYCEDPSCDMHEHRVDSDNYIENVLNAVSSSAGISLPWSSSSSGGASSTKIPGWNEQVKPFKNDAKFWFSVWLSAGKPQNCELQNIMRRTRNIYHYNVKKCKKAEEQIRKEKLLSAILEPNSDVDIFKEIKQMRKSKESLVNKIDDKTKNIEEHFAGIYENLYNSVDDENDLREVAKIIESKINGDSAREVRRVTPDLLKEAVKKVKPNKSDPVYDFTSDCLKNAPNDLFIHLSNILRSFLIHAHVSFILLLSTLVPIVKDKLGNLCSSKNYRSIAISSLFLKIVDWVIILLYGDHLNLHDLQFAYQPNCSTNMCTWLVVETIDYFLRNGGEVFACAMDMTKAFDLVVHSRLLMKLLGASMPAIIVRLMLIMFLMQHTNVRWLGSFSRTFYLRNGCKQGAVLSAIAYCIYVNGLFEELSRNKSGCWVGSTFLGLQGYSDDNILLAPSRESLQSMLTICEKYVENHGLKFSTDQDPKKSKTRCLTFLQRERVIKPVKLCGNQLPWVNTCKHLGNTIVSSRGKDIRTHDIKIKRATFINKCNEIMQEFHFAHPRTRLWVNKIHNSHFYGSVLWPLKSKEVSALEKTWNVSIRRMFDLPRETHTYLVEPISEEPHVRSILAKRFVSFVQSLRVSKKKPLREVLKVLEYDTMSVTGGNLRQILNNTNIDDVRNLKPSDITENYKEIPIGEEYRVNIIKEIIKIRNKQLEVPGFEKHELEEIMRFVCVS